MLLAGDIGGTNCRLACFQRETARLRLVATAEYKSANYRGLDEVIGKFLQQHSISDPMESAVFGVAGPVEDGKFVHATNLPWVIDQTYLCRSLNTSNVCLINDLVANAYGTSWLTSDDYVVLNAGTNRAGSNKALISAGTGLGEAGLVYVDGRYAAVASEGGHASFAPTSDIEVELLQFLRQKYGHVSWERVVSGAGLANIYEFLRQCRRQPPGTGTLEKMSELENLDLPARISQAAILGIDAIAEQALDQFVRLYGAEAGNVALKFLAVSAMYIGGGIAPKILPKLMDGAFLGSFVSKGRFSKLLENIPIFVILNDQTALLGAALLAARQAGYEIVDAPIMEAS